MTSEEALSLEREVDKYFSGAKRFKPQIEAFKRRLTLDYKSAECKRYSEQLVKEKENPKSKKADTSKSNSKKSKTEKLLVSKKAVVKSAKSRKSKGVLEFKPKPRTNTVSNITQDRLEFMVDKPLSLLATTLDWSINRVRGIISKLADVPESKLNEKTIITRDMLIACEVVIGKRMHSMVKEEKQIERAANSRIVRSNATQSTSGVYDKIATYGLGKVISIRSK
jgi:hypothetical protein